MARGIDRSSKEQEGAGRAYAPAVEASEPDRSAATSQAEGSGEPVRETEPEPASTTPATEPAPSGNTFTTASGEVLTYSQKLSVEDTAYSCEGYAGHHRHRHHRPVRGHCRGPQRHPLWHPDVYRLR